MSGNNRVWDILAAPNRCIERLALLEADVKGLPDWHRGAEELE
jgi:hypothetical protein